MSIEVRHLRLIDAIAKEGGITKAAAKLYMTQSAASHQLREIESYLNVALFHRRNRKMVLTDAGKRMLDSARVMLDEIELAEQRIRKLAAGQEGTLRVSTQFNTSYKWLTEAYKMFRLRYPGIDLEIVAEEGHKPTEALLSRKVDLVITSDDVNDPDFFAFPLLQEGKRQWVALMIQRKPMPSYYLDFANSLVEIFRRAGTAESQRSQRKN